MKLLIIISSLIVLTACSQVRFSPEACTITVQTNGSLITCPDGSSQLIPNGQNGQPGATGPTGPQGSTGSNGTNGSNGSNGTNGNGFNPGLECDVYSIQSGDWSNPPVNWDKMLSDGTLAFTVVEPNFNTPNESDVNPFQGFTAAQQAALNEVNFALDCSGYINIPETNSYSFTLDSDDGSELSINNTVLINMPQGQSYTGTTVSVQLNSGLNKINVLYFQGPQTNQGLTLYWQGPSNQGLGTLEVIPSSAFTH